jgi:hypothetical protein
MSLTMDYLSSIISLIAGLFSILLNAPKVWIRVSKVWEFVSTRRGSAPNVGARLPYKSRGSAHTFPLSFSIFAWTS